MPKPPDAILAQAARMPKDSYAFWVIKNGKVENAEFCVWDLDSYFEEMWKFKKALHPTQLKRANFVGWVKKKLEYETINLNSPTVE
jgi:hypothetical protein